MRALVRGLPAGPSKSPFLPVPVAVLRPPPDALVSRQALGIACTNAGGRLFWFTSDSPEKLVEHTSCTVRRDDARYVVPYLRTPFIRSLMAATMAVRSPTRRALLGALTLPWLVGGCSTPLPLGALPANDADASARLRDSAEAHGLAAYRRLTDINVSYTGQWRPLVGRIQPEVVDEGFRGSSQERLLPLAGITAQAYTGPMGRKQVNWRRGNPASADLGEVAICFNDVRSTDDAAQQAAALVAGG